MNVSIVRANGGHLWHHVPPGTRRAICGFKPSSPKGHLIRHRGRWVLPGTMGTPTCKKCLEELNNPQ